MTSLLDFMYTGSLNIDQSNVWSILGAATQLQMSAVIELCDKFLKERTVLKSSRETTERSICLAGSDAEMEDWTIPENEDAKESVRLCLVFSTLNLHEALTRCYTKDGWLLYS